MENVEGGHAAQEQRSLREAGDLRSSEIQVLSPMNFQSPSTDAPPAEAAPAADNTPPAETPEVPHAPEPNTTIAKAAS
jgi:hypothetical protein